jgi:branched-chain amino acid transport system ATP-binding protein
VSALELRDLHAGYGAMGILHGLDLSAPSGGLTAILGANGAGKTTTLRSIMGRTQVTGGSIKIDGVDVTGWPTHRLIRETGLAIVPEGRQLFADLTVRENLIMGAYATGISSSERNARIHAVEELLPLVGRKLPLKASSLSGGEQQIVSIGRALMSRPRILLADEVSQGVSPVLTLELWNVFRTVAATGTTVVLVEQNVAAAFRVAAHAVVIREGRTILEGDPQSVAADHRIRDAYLT